MRVLTASQALLIGWHTLIQQKYVAEGLVTRQMAGKLD